MRVTTADLWEPRPGAVLRWEVTARGLGVPTALTINQQNHLHGAAAGADSVWLAAAFDVDGPIDREALLRTWQDFVRRHSSLHVEALAGPDGPRARRHDPDTLSWTLSHADATTTVEETRALLGAALREGCRPFGYPAFLPAAISRADRSTVVFAMDHLHCDAYSITVAVDDLSRLYAAHRRGASVELPAAQCYVTAVEQTGAAPARVADDDPRLRAWVDFAVRRGLELPSFPLDLGVPPGERAPQATVVRQLTGAEEVDRLGGRARDLGASTYAAVLAATGAAIADLGGPSRLDTLVPVSRRGDEASRRSVGWYTTTVPVTIETAGDADDGGLEDRAIAAAGEAVRAGVALSAVPIDQALGALPGPLLRPRGDVFMVSWVDYRHVPGAAQHRALDAHHISAPTMADDVQMWFARTPAGLAVRVRYPDTVTAHDLVDGLLDRLTLHVDGAGARQPVLA